MANYDINTPFIFDKNDCYRLKKLNSYSKPKFI